MSTEAIRPEAMRFLDAYREMMELLAEEPEDSDYLPWSRVRLADCLERLTLQREDPFRARSYPVLATGGAATPAIVEVNMDLLRAWVVPMPCGERYSLIGYWGPEEEGRREL